MDIVIRKMEYEDIPMIGPIEQALFEAEMYAFKEWLPLSGYKHAKAPELEVYPARDSQVVEFWLPIAMEIQNN